MSYKREMHSNPSSSSSTDRESVRLRGWVLFSLRRWGEMAGSSIREVAAGRTAHPWKRGGLLAGLLPLSLGKWLIDWLCLGLDELIFPGARCTDLGRPVMVLGPPRSGTTRLHRVLAREEKFRTSPTWEVFLAPSIVQKRLFRGWIALDAKLGRPLARTAQRVERHLFKGFDATHPSSLAEPEEDYFYLSSLFACTGWLLAFPADVGLRRFLPGADEDDAEARREVLGFYRYCLRKQMYDAPPGACLLCKNASFASWLDVLPEAFPEAQFLVCRRAPGEAVPSMLSLAASTRADFGFAADDPAMRDLWIASMRAHYRAAAEAVRRLPPDRMAVVSMDSLRSALSETVQALATRFGWEWSAGFAAVLREEDEKSKNHRSRHRYRLQDFGLDVEGLRRDFADIPEPTEGLTFGCKHEKEGA